MIEQLAEVEVREVQGLYGPLRISERLLQQIWERRDYSASRLRTLDGQRIRVLRTGSWNHREGPDFLDATLEIGGELVRGDVEIHFRSRNWREHGHHLDPAFSSVVLHVVLFLPDAGESEAVTARGGRPFACALLEALDCGLEEYAEQEAVRRLCGGAATDLSQAFSTLPEVEREDCLKRIARERWKAKVNWAVKRLNGMDYEEVSHQVFLEVLGYRRNRAPMAAIALEHPLSEFRENPPDPDELFAARQGEWKLAGVRPANHPRVRLQQYSKTVSRKPNWPDLARESSLDLLPGGAAEETSRFRKRREMSRKREELAERVLSGAIGGGRLNTWVVDGWLPLAAAETGEDLFGWWFHWHAGDAPEGLVRFLREIGVTGKRSSPLCNGWVQGGLGAVTSRLA